MNKMVLFLVLAFNSVSAFSNANAQAGTATTLMTKDFPMCLERKAWCKPSTSLPARSPSHIDITQISLCMSRRKHYYTSER